MSIDEDGFEIVDSEIIDEDIYLSNLLYKRDFIEEDTILRLQSNSVVIVQDDYYQQEDIDRLIENILQHSIYMFSDTSKNKQIDVRCIPFAPIYILFGQLGYHLTIPRQVIQEYIDLFKTLKMMTKRAENHNLVLGWNFPEWSKDMACLKQEIQSFFDMIYQKPRPSVLDGYTVIEYNPNYYLNLPDRVLRPSQRECIRAVLQASRKPISIHSINTVWFFQLFQIFVRYLKPRPPTSIEELFQQLKDIFQTMLFSDQQTVIAICEDVLGGKDLELISTNLDKWIYINRDIVPSSVKYLLAMK